MARNSRIRALVRWEGVGAEETLNTPCLLEILEDQKREIDNLLLLDPLESKTNEGSEKDRWVFP
jgi:hypothetical protein